MNQPSLFGEPSGDSAVAHIDGGSRGNPGPAGYGVRIERADGTVVELKEPVGVATNNVAEYRGLLAALTWAMRHGIDRFHVRSDSLLLVKQMRGQYRVKHAGLLPLWQEAPKPGTANPRRAVRACTPRIQQGRRQARERSDGRGGELAELGSRLHNLQAGPDRG